MQCFCEDVPASVAARLLLINRKTVNAWYTMIRKRLLLEIPKLPEIGSESQFLAYHKRRIARFNGLSRASRAFFLLESRLRYQKRAQFRAEVLGIVEDLLR